MNFASLMSSYAITPLRTMNFFEAVGLFVLVVLLIVLALCFVIIPLSRYIALRIVLFFRYLFCHAKFAKVGINGFIIPHFWNQKPDFMLLSGKKLYLIKLKSYRKVKSKVVFADPHTWLVSSFRGAPPNDQGGVLDSITMFFYKLAVHERKRKSPVKLVKYAASINNALKDTDINCVPVVLINPSIMELRTKSNIELIDGDTIFYGLVIANNFFPSKPEKAAVSGKEARRIFRTARHAMRKKHFADMKKGY